MPIYEYVCDDCRERYEALVRSAGQKILCPKCSSPRHTLQLSVFNAGKASSGGSTFAGAAAETCGGGTCGCTPHTCGCE